MKKFLTLIIGVIFLIQSPCIFGQTDKDYMDIARDLYKSGDYSDALDVYLLAAEINPNNAMANLMSGKCYMQTICCRKDAITSFLKAYDLDPTVDQKIYYLIASAYHKTYQFDDAIKYYNKYKEELETNRRDFLDVDVDSEIKSTNRWIYECNNGKFYVDHPSRTQIINLGLEINSPFEDYAPAISSDGQEIYYTSKRKGGFSDKKNMDNNYFEDIWHSTLNGDKWSIPNNVGAPINDDGHNSAISLSPDGNRLFIYSAENNGDILFSDKKKDGAWSATKPMIFLNTEFVESSISITSDGKMMFYTSNKPGGFGGKDIYYCDLNEELECINSPKNIGSELNSEYDEEAPFYDITNNILYFASKGHKGMGGYDLYETSYNESTNKWSPPVNLGVPVNSSDDDVFMSVTADGRTGYYATYKEDSYGGNDIYKIYPIDKILEETMDSTSLAAQSTVNQNDTIDVAANKPNLKSTVVIKVSDEIGKLLNANIEIKLKGGSTILSSGIAQKGEYTYVADYKEESRYMISCEMNGYFFHNDYFTLNQTNDGQNVVIEIKLRPTQVMEIRPLRNIYFGFDKKTLTPQSYAEIDKLYNLLKNDPKIHIEIAGHTDFIGSREYNKSLSYQRANAVCQALIKKGISPDRVTPKGYGEEHPLATNDDELEGRELNRRTEFIIIPH